MKKGWLRRLWGFNQENRDRFVEQIASQVAPKSRVLDAGAGPGRYRPCFAHCEYLAHDFGQEPSTVGRYTKLDYQCDITAIPVPDGSFDVVLCTEVLEHVPEPIRVIRELSRLLRPEGMLLVTAPLGSFLHQEPYHYYGGYTPHWYAKFLPEAGLRIIRLERNCGFFSLLAQEAGRFSYLVSPRRTGGWRKALLAPLWILSLPTFLFVLAPLGFVLDRLELEKIATVGYHVLAVKRENATLV
jgi:SAM-dependent methyltransferase